MEETDAAAASGFRVQALRPRQIERRKLETNEMHFEYGIDHGCDKAKLASQRTFSEKVWIPNQPILVELTHPISRCLEGCKNVSDVPIR